MKRIVLNDNNTVAIYSILFFLCLFSLTALSHYIILEISKKCLYEAKNATSKVERIRYLETATLLNDTNSNRENAGEALLEAKDYRTALSYLGSTRTTKASRLRGEAYYQIRSYDKAIESVAKCRAFDVECRSLNIRSLLKLGRPRAAMVAMVESELSANNELMEIRNIVTGKDSLYVFNYLVKKGFPQSGYSLLVEAEDKDKLNRDGLLTLAQAQIAYGLKAEAYVTLTFALNKDPYYPQTYRQLIEIGTRLDKDTTEYKMRLSKMTW